MMQCTWDAYHGAIKQVIQDCLETETSSCDSDIEDSKHNGLLSSNGVGQSACLLTSGSHCQEEGEPSDSEEVTLADCIVSDIAYCLE